MPFHEQIVGFAGERVDTKGYANLQVSLGLEKAAKELKIRFLLVEAEASYSVLLGRLCLNAFGAIVFTPPPHLVLKYPSDDGKVCTVRANQKMARECYAVELRVKPRSSGQINERSVVAMAELDQRVNTEDRMEPIGDTQPFGLGSSEEQVTAIGRSLKQNQAKEIRHVLTSNKDLFTWTVADMPGIRSDIMCHKLSLFKDVRPVTQKKRRCGNYWKRGSYGK